MDTENPELDELSAWLVDELHDVALGDKRLNRRLLTTGAQLAARPSGSIRLVPIGPTPRPPTGSLRMPKRPPKRSARPIIAARGNAPGGTNGSLLFRIRPT